jgi:hypothetical protein
MTSSIFGNPRRPRRLTLGGLLPGAVVGAGLLYFLDARRGAARRARLRQRAERFVHDTREFVQSGARDLEHRASGLAHEASARLQHQHAPEEVMAERVRAALGHLCSHPRAIEIEVRGAEVELRGPVLTEEHGRIVRGVRLIRGVHHVVDRLSQHKEATGISSLQGGALRGGGAPMLMRESWAPGARLVAGAGGTLLVLRALLGRGLLRPVYGLAGGALLARAAGNETLRQLGERAAERARVLAGEDAEPGEKVAGRAGEGMERTGAAAEQAGTVEKAAGAVKKAAGKAKARARKTAEPAPERVREGPDAASLAPERTVEEVKSPAERHAPPPEETMPERVRPAPAGAERTVPRAAAEEKPGPGTRDPAFTGVPEEREAERSEPRREEPRGEGE